MVDLKNVCPVCGFEMDDPPRNFNICPSCVTEFGLHDFNATISELRAAWLANGPIWWSKFDQQPEDWQPLEQLKRVMQPISSHMELALSAPSVSGSYIQFSVVAPAKSPEP